MASSSKLMVWEGERRFPVRLRLALPAGGFGTRLTAIHEWLDQNAGRTATDAALAGIAPKQLAVENRP